MRTRSNHTPSLNSKAFPVGACSITMLPNSRRQSDRLARRLETLVPSEPEPPISATLLHWALLVGMAWDDPGFELETSVPEDVDGMEDAALIELATRLYDEIDHPANRRLFQPMAVLSAGLQTLLIGISGN